MFRLVLSSCSAFLACLPLLCVAQTARLDSDRVFVGDIVTLVIELNTKFLSLYALDTSEMEEDFKVLEVKPSASRVSETEDQKYRTRWRLRIVPRRTGKLEIPSFSVGGKHTPSLRLDVLPLPAQGRQMVAVKVEASPVNPYIGQQMNVILRLIHNTSLFEGSWSEPEFEQARVMSDVDETHSSTIENGVRVSTLERRMVLFPGAAGTLTGSPAGYHARVSVRRDHETNATDPGSTSRWIFRDSKPVQVQVRDIPTRFSGKFWLPARELEISQHWSGADELRVGDTLDGGLTIIARGLPGDALPTDLLSGASDRFKLYADQAIHHDRFDGRTLVGQLDQSYAIVLIGPGTIQTPGVRLKWWDLDEDVEKEAVAPGRTITVAPASPSPEAGGFPESPQLARPSHDVSPQGSSRPGSFITAVIVVVLLLLVAYWRFRAGDGITLRGLAEKYHVRRALKHACLANDPAGVRRALIHWARQQWPGTSINGLYQIREKLRSRELKDELSRLDAALYSASQTEWEGQRLWRLAIAERKHAGRDYDRGDRLHSYWPRIAGLDG